MLRSIELVFLEPTEGWTEVNKAFIVDDRTVVSHYSENYENVLSFRHFDKLRIKEGQNSLTLRIGEDTYQVIEIQAPTGVDVSKLDELSITEFAKKYFEKRRL